MSHPNPKSSQSFTLPTKLATKPHSKETTPTRKRKDGLISVEEHLVSTPISDVLVSKSNNQGTNQRNSLFNMDTNSLLQQDEEASRTNIKKKKNLQRDVHSKDTNIVCKEEDGANETSLPIGVQSEKSLIITMKGPSLTSESKVKSESKKRLEAKMMMDMIVIEMRNLNQLNKNSEKQENDPKLQDLRPKLKEIQESPPRSVFKTPRKSDDKIRRERVNQIKKSAQEDSERKIDTQTQNSGSEKQEKKLVKKVQTVRQSEKFGQREDHSTSEKRLSTIPLTKTLNSTNMTMNTTFSLQSREESMNPSQAQSEKLLESQMNAGKEESKLEGGNEIKKEKKNPKKRKREINNDSQKELKEEENHSDILRKKPKRISDSVYHEESQGSNMITFKKEMKELTPAKGKDILNRFDKIMGREGAIFTELPIIRKETYFGNGRYPERTRIPPLLFFKGERPIYQRIGQGLELVSVCIEDQSDFIQTANYEEDWESDLTDLEDYCPKTSA